MFFWECGMETGISVNDPMCGEECSIRKGELCLLYIELFMLFFSINLPKVRQTKTSTQA